MEFVQQGIFLYHFLYYTLGFIGALIILPIEGYNFVCNLGFVGSKYQMVFYQIVAHLFTVIMVL